MIFVQVVRIFLMISLSIAVGRESGPFTGLFAFVVFFMYEAEQYIRELEHHAKQTGR